MGLRSLIGIETSAAKALRSALDLSTAKLNREVLQSVANRHHDEALQLIAKYDAAKPVKALQSVYDHMAISAAIFGASQVKAAQHTKFAQGQGHALVMRGASMMAKMATEIATTRVRKYAAAVVHSHGSRHGSEVRHSIMRKTFEPMCCQQHNLVLACEPVRLFKAESLIQNPEEDISDALNAATMGNGRMASDIAANLTTTRLAAYGFLSQASDDGMKTYQINSVLDERVCDVCAYMHGQTIDVEKALTQTEDLLNADNPDDLADIAPWPDQSKQGLEDFVQMDTDALQEAGYMVPPFHPGCRCVLVPAGTIDDADVSNPMSAAEAASAVDGDNWYQALKDLLFGAEEAGAEAETGAFLADAEEAGADLEGLSDEEVEALGYKRKKPGTD